MLGVLKVQQHQGLLGEEAGAAVMETPGCLSSPTRTTTITLSRSTCWRSPQIGSLTEAAIEDSRTPNFYAIDGTCHLAALSVFSLTKDRNASEICNTKANI